MKRLILTALVAAIVCQAIATAILYAQDQIQTVENASSVRVFAEWLGGVLGIFIASIIVGGLVYFFRRAANEPDKGALSAIATSIVITMLMLAGVMLK